MRGILIREILAVIILALGFCLVNEPAKAQSKEIITIGILITESGPMRWQSDWQKTLELLNNRFADKTFRIEFFNHPELNQAVHHRTVDYILTNPVHYIYLTRTTGLSSALLTLIPKFNGQALHGEGGVIFTSKDNKEIFSLQSLENRRIATGSKQSLNGYIAQLWAMHSDDPDLVKSIGSETSGLANDQIVQQVLSGEADAGFMSSKALEILIRSNRVDRESVRILNAQNLTGYPFESSTYLFPQWPLASLPHADETATNQLVSALLDFGHLVSADTLNGIHEFHTPQRYQPVVKAMEILNVAPFAKDRKELLEDTWMQYRLEITIVVISILIMLMFMISLLSVTHKLWQTKEKLVRNEVLDKLQNKIATSANETRSPQEILRITQLHLASQMKWPVSFVIEFSDGPTPQVNPDLLHCSDHEAFGLFLNEASKTFFDERNLAMVEALQSNQPVILENLMNDKFLWRLVDKHEKKIKSCIILPVGKPHDVTTMIVFFHDGAVHKDSLIFNCLKNISHQVTRVFERYEAERQLVKLQTAVEQSPLSIIMTNTAGEIEYVNRSFTQTTGYDRSEVLGKNPRFLKSEMTPKETHAEMWRTISNGKQWQGEIYNRKKDGSSYWEYVIISPIYDNDGDIINYLALKEDISIRRSYEEQLDFQANYDPLTNLPNRALAMDRLQNYLVKASRLQGHVALMYVNIDHLGRVNDAFGHATGDEVIAEVGQRIEKCVSEDFTVARIGSDEFLVIQPLTSLVAHAEVFAQKILTAGTKPFVIDGESIELSLRIGIAVSPDDGSDTLSLIKNAHAATLVAKEMGGNTYRFFTAEMNIQAQERIRMESALGKAIANEELSLHFQPQIDIKTNRVIGAEALLRWQNNDLGMVPPNKFIPLAEETGKILPISTWVLEEAIRACQKIRDAGFDHLHIAINMSPQQMENYDIVDYISESLQDANLSPGWLELEITEGALLKDRDLAAKILRGFREKGLKTAIDDFGTGYSSLSYLKKFDFDRLKIDQSFVRNLEEDHNDRALVLAILAMADSLGLEVIAEGIETSGQLSYLRDWHCEIGQGYYFSRPVPFEEFMQFLKQDAAIIKQAT